MEEMDNVPPIALQDQCPYRCLLHRDTACTAVAQPAIPVLPWSSSHSPDEGSRIRQGERLSTSSISSAQGYWM